MYYYPTHNKKFYLHSEIRRYFHWFDFPEKIDDEYLSRFNIFPLKQTYYNDDYTKTAIEKNPIQINNVWHTQWEIRDATEEEIQERTFLKSIQIRDMRNKLLAETDWTQSKDIPDSISEPWAVYRQSLRDIPEQEGFPWNVVWPTIKNNNYAS